jgi:hypothetical protein
MLFNKAVFFSPALKQPSLRPPSDFYGVRVAHLFYVEFL